MSMEQYLKILRYKLEEGGLPNDELEDAVRFYEEIFLDAGKEHEKETAENLGSPEELARKILLDNGIHADGKAEFLMEDAVSPDEQYAYNQQKYEQQAQRDRNDMLLKIILFCVTAPVWLPVVCTLGGVALALLVVAAVLVAVFFIVGFAVAVGGAVTLFSVPPAGLCMVGAGLFLIGLTLLIVSPVVRGIWSLAVRFFNWVVNVIRRAFSVGGAGANG